MKLDLSTFSSLARARRTIFPEQFSSATVDKRTVEEILTNAIWAPTHGKTEPWRFDVYMESARNRLIPVVDHLYRAQTPKEKFNGAKLERLQARIGVSPVVVLMAMRPTPNTKIPEQEEMAAVACAGQNILLGATAAGLGAFWSTPNFIYAPEAAEALGFEPGDRVMGMVYIGRPHGDLPKGRRKNLDEVVRWVEDDE